VESSVAFGMGHITSLKKSAAVFQLHWGFRLHCGYVLYKALEGLQTLINIRDLS